MRFGRRKRDTNNTVSMLAGPLSLRRNDPSQVAPAVLQQIIALAPKERLGR